MTFCANIDLRLDFRWTFHGTCAPHFRGTLGLETFLWCAHRTSRWASNGEGSVKNVVSICEFLWIDLGLPLAKGWLEPRERLWWNRLGLGRPHYSCHRFHLWNRLKVPWFNFNLKEKFAKGQFGWFFMLCSCVTGTVKNESFWMSSLGYVCVHTYV